MTNIIAIKSSFLFHFGGKVLGPSSYPHSEGTLLQLVRILCCRALRWCSAQRGHLTINFVVYSDESVLLDLKHLLLEAKQKIPPVLAVLQAENEGYLDLGGMMSQ